MTEPSPPVQPVPSGRTLAKATVIAVLAAVIVLVSAVLPAEYGIDPLGIGRTLGLGTLFESSKARASSPDATRPSAGGPIFSQAGGYRTDTRELKLGPYEYIEFKYELDPGASMIYEWKANAPVTFNFHTDPAGKPKDASESFEKGEAAERHGAYVAPYAGIHGWYWENPGAQEVVVHLSTTGFYRSAKEFHFDGTSQVFDLTSAQ